MVGLLMCTAVYQGLYSLIYSPSDPDKTKQSLASDREAKKISLQRLKYLVNKQKTRPHSLNLIVSLPSKERPQMNENEVRHH